MLGHSPSGEQDWRGIVLGVALYDRVLSSQDVAIHYRLWQENAIERFWETCWGRAVHARSVTFRLGAGS